MCRRLFLVFFFIGWPSCVFAQSLSANVVSSCGTPNTTYVAGQSFPLTVDTTGKLCGVSSSSGGTVTLGAGTAAIGTVGPGYTSAQTPITGNGTGSTGSVVGTLAAASGKTTYICGFSVSAIGTLAVGPITIAGTVGSSLVYQLTALAAGAVLTQTFTPCIPSSATNTAITTTTTADASASAVDVNSWGYQQ